MQRIYKKSHLTLFGLAVEGPAAMDQAGLHSIPKTTKTLLKPEMSESYSI